MATGDIYSLYLEEITPTGDALGRFEGKTIFVKGGAPDETVNCRITEERKTWSKAELLEITKPSPVRTDSVCKYYGKCGGCNLAHINYDAQLAVKRKILKDSFLKTSGQPPPEIITIDCNLPWEYRNRIQFHCLRNNYSFGFKEQGSGEIIHVSDCPVAVHGIREFLSKPKNPREKSFSIPPEKDRFTVFSKDDVFLNEGGQKRGKIKLLDREILVDTEVFFQSNCFMLEKFILELKKEACKADQSLPMADLYGGVGTFALFLCDFFPGIILAEENKTAVSAARENLRGKDAEFFTLKDTDWQKILTHKISRCGFAVADPPRAGLAQKLAVSLAQTGPPVLAYVSCDPASLARDSKILTDGIYKLKKLDFFDFYPQTSHIESLAVFELKSTTPL
ncbi:MAG: TRAM domain-containing protein [Treponema sp.]|nr:TRAM domain-containing protein [Treponema sp.]MCL2272286.1 TRAM domain-containing protein [Treponema sp.]